MPGSLIMLSRDYYTTLDLYSKGDYHTMTSYPERYDRLGDILVALGLGRGKLLEVGCLTGYGMKILERDFGFDVYGIDPLPQAIKERVHNRVILGSADKLPFKDEEFDVVVSVGVLEHIHRSGIREVLFELDRVGRYNVHTIHLAYGDSHEDKYHVTVEKPSWWWKKLEEKRMFERWFLFHEP